MSQRGISPATILRELEGGSADSIPDLQMHHDGLRGIKLFEDWSSEICSGKKKNT